MDANTTSQHDDNGLPGPVGQYAEDDGVTVTKPRLLTLTSQNDALTVQHVGGGQIVIGIVAVEGNKALVSIDVSGGAGFEIRHETVVSATDPFLAKRFVRSI